MHVFIFHHQNSAIECDADSGKMLEFHHLIQKYPDVWTKSIANEFGRLMKGVGKRIPTGSNTMRFIHKSEIPHNKVVTYAHIVCDYRPNQIGQV